MDLPNLFPDMINAVSTVLGHLPRRSQHIQKNVVDDTVIKLVEGVLQGRYKEDEIKRLLDGLTVGKVHRPNHKRVTIRYEAD